MDTNKTAPAPAGGPKADALPDDFQDRFGEAVRACRVDNWRRAYEILSEMAGETGAKRTLPGVFYTYLGVALARCEGRRHDGMELVRYGLKISPRQADGWYNLALLDLILGRRAEALRAIDKGLRLSPFHRRLKELRREMGLRRRPPVPFLHRSNPVNVVAGQIRHLVDERRRRRREEEELFGES